MVNCGRLTGFYRFVLKLKTKESKLFICLKRTRRKEGEPEAGGHSQVGEHADGHAGRALGGTARGVGKSTRRHTSAGVHHRVQDDEARQGRVRVVGRQ